MSCPKNRFFYRALSQKERALYELLYEGLCRRQRDYRFDITDLSFARVFSALTDDCPELYFVRGSYEISYDKRAFSFQNGDLFCFTESEQADIDRRLEEIFTSLDIPENDFEAELCVHAYLVHHCRYDHDHATRSGILHVKNHCLVGPLLDGIGVCEGFARATQYLLQRAGKEVVFVVGTIAEDGRAPRAGDEPNHAWVAVSVMGSWYHLDISHDICLSHSTQGATVHRTPMYCFFNVSDDEICRDHLFDAKKYAPIRCTSYRYNYYQYYRRFFHNTTQIKAAILAHFESVGRNGTPRRPRRFTFRVGAHLSPTDVQRIVDEACDALPPHRRVLSQSVNVYSVELTFSSTHKNTNFFGGVLWQLRK